MTTTTQSDVREPHNLKRGVIIVCANCRKAEPELPEFCTPLPFEQQMSATEVEWVEMSLLIPATKRKPTPETQRAEQGSVDEGESSRAIDRARRSAERLADQRDTEQSEVEAGEWYFIKWYDVDLKAYPQEPKFAIEHKETLVAIALEQATAERIINDHRLAALVSQAETALEAITPRCDFVVDRDKSTRCGAVAVAEGSFGLKYCRDHKGDRDTVDAGVAVEAALSAIRKEREK
jgi:hypothetical protein